MRNSIKILFLLSSGLILQITSAHSQNVVSTAEAIDQIEKSLSPSKAASKDSSRSKNNFSDKDKSQNNSFGHPDIEMTITNPKDDKKMIEKQSMAYSAALTNQHEVAIELYKQILKSDPKNNYAKFGLATSYHKIGQYRQAKALYSELLKSAPANRDEIIGNLLEVIVEESPNDAIYLLARLSAQNPNSSYILARSAMAYDKIGKTDQAILLLNRAIALDSDKIEYKFNLAVIYDRIKDYTKALSLYHDVLTSYVESEDVNGAIPILEVKNRAEFIRNNPDVGTPIPQISNK